MEEKTYLIPYISPSFEMKALNYNVVIATSLYETSERVPMYMNY